MGTRKCTARQLAALKRGREKLRHKRTKKGTNASFAFFPFTRTLIHLFRHH